MATSQTILIYLLCCAAGYLTGSVPFGYIIGRANGKDIRRYGSGNIGATNVLRVIGPWWGRLCFFLDFLKGFLPVGAVKFLILSGRLTDGFGVLPLAMLAAVVAGHMFSCFLKFRGGKGIATAAGGVFALAPLPLAAAFVIWIAVFKLSGYVSLGSILAAAALPFLAWGCNLRELGERLSPVTIGFLGVIAVLAVIRHASNIRRLIAGTENRFGGHAGSGGTEEKK